MCPSAPRLHRQRGVRGPASDRRASGGLSRFRHGCSSNSCTDCRSSARGRTPEIGAARRLEGPSERCTPCLPAPSAPQPRPAPRGGVRSPAARTALQQLLADLEGERTGQPAPGNSAAVEVPPNAPRRAVIQRGTVRPAQAAPPPRTARNRAGASRLKRLPLPSHRLGHGHLGETRSGVSLRGRRALSISVMPWTQLRAGWWFERVTRITGTRAQGPDSEQT